MNKSEKRLIALTAVTLGASMLLTTSASGSDLWADDGQIIYISCEMAVCNPHTSKDDGTGEEPIVIPGFEDTPTISNNGKRIAFRQAGDIWVAKSDGSGLDNITESPGEFESEPDISPDGKAIAYSQGNPSRDIVRSKIDGSDVTPVLDGADDDSAPEWSPDGKRIAFNRRIIGSHYDVYTVKKDGSGEKPLTDTDNKSEVNPTWSPDGKRIALTQTADMGSKLKTMAATGGPMKPVTTNSPHLPSRAGRLTGSVSRSSDSRTVSGTCSR